jgi:hypothetical protein
MANQLDAETFLSGVEMIQQQLRIKRDDQWSTNVCKLKYASFMAEFPEVSSVQFFWACEQWIQMFSAKDFATFPTWQELMIPLYAVENGRANRSWGFKRDLPAFIAPTPSQKAQLPERPRSIAGAADPLNRDAYEVVITPREEPQHLLPESGLTENGLTAEQWASYLRELEAEIGTSD